MADITDEPHPDLLGSLVEERRQHLGESLQARCQGEVWGLALSGGGVRSATFCYGLITALARLRVFWRFDLLSTVSGGGYIGAMLGRLAQSSTSAEGLQDRLAKDGPASKECRWLRSNSRYLIPRGSRDWLFVVATFIRNLLAIHIELGILGVLLGCLLGAIDLAAWWSFDHYIGAADASQIPARLQQWAWVAPWPTLWLILPLPLLLAAWAAIEYGYLPMSNSAAAEADARRHRVTDRLGSALRWAAGIFLLGAIDWIGWRIANKPTQLLALGGSFAVLLAALRAVLPLVQSGSPAGAAPSSLRMPLIIDLAGRIGLLTLILFWTSVVHAVLTSHVWVADQEQVDFGLAALLIVLALGGVLLWMAVAGRSLDFLNRSSLHHFYRSRLTRTYLGAANAARQAESKVTETSVQDDIEFAKYTPQASGGPVHLINVCVNQTYQQHGLFNIDRKGQLMTLAGPGHYRVECGDWQRMSERASETLGTWMAVSGAAAAPGLGSSTRPGWATLLTVLGIRLGYWWDSRDRTKIVPRGSGRIPKYSHLLDELLARLPGSASRIQYLSDGGHSENTGAYALLAAGCKLIVLADCGADPDYRFDDLENLIRRARIDLGVLIRFMAPDETLSRSIGTLDDLASAHSEACLAVASVDYGASRQPGVLIVVKPNLTTGLPEDIYNYSRDNPQFPQQTTADQFFGEDQWESYYALGLHLGSLLTDELLLKLATVTGLGTPAEPATAATTAQPEAGHDKTSAGKPKAEAGWRRPIRLGVRAATTTLGLGVILTSATGVWTAFQNSSAPAPKPAVDARALRPLYETYATMTLGASGQNEPGIARMAAQVMMLWQASRAAGQDAALEANKEALDMLKITAGLCQPLRDRFAACRTFLQTFDCPAAPPVKSPVTLNYGYWARHEPGGTLQRQARRASYCEEGATVADQVMLARPAKPFEEVQAAPEPAGATESEPATAAATPPPPPPPPPAPTPAPAPAPAPAGGSTAATSPAPSAPAGGLPAPATAATTTDACSQLEVEPICKGINIFIQIYGPEGRDKVGALRSMWRAAGAAVPPIEDVNDSARRQGRNPPRPYAKATVIAHQQDSRACANQLALLACQDPGSWEVKDLTKGYASSPRTIEVWLPPQAVAAGFDQWVNTRGYCYQEAAASGQGASSFGVHCHPSKAACEEARGPNSRRLQSPCLGVILQDLNDPLPYQGWAGSRYKLAASPFGPPFPALPASGVAK